MAKPVVDGIEQALSGRAQVVRLSVTSGVGREMASRHGVRAVPTLIVFDGQGEPRLRQVGRVNKDAVLAVVAQIESRPISSVRVEGCRGGAR